MPKTRLTARLCSAPTVKSPPSSDGSPSTTSPKSVSVTPLTTTPTGAPQAAAAVPKSPASTISTAATGLPAAEAEVQWEPFIPLCASSADYFLYKDDANFDSDQESDLDDLPSFSTTEVSSFPSKGDAVWVKYRHRNFWPCLILQSNPKTKKLHVVFLDDLPVNGQNTGEQIYMKYNKNKVVPYNHENKSKFETEGKNLESVEQRKKFQAALGKMVDYMTKKALGLKAACKVFLNEPVSSEDESSTKLPASLPSQPSSQQPGQPYSSKRKRKMEDQEERKKERQPSVDGDSAENKAAQKKTAKKPMTPSETRAMRKLKNQPLVDYICSKQMKSYLTKIYRGQSPSQRHHLYMQGSIRKIQTNSTGPIDDDGQLDMILNNIGAWHQELTQQTFPNMDYLLWVWLPEAIVYGLKRTRHCGDKRAQEIFEKGIQLTKGEHLEIHRQLIS